MIDTHSHLQFKAFEGKTDEVIKSAKDSGIEKIIVVGTNLETSKKAIELAEKHEDLYASIGLHPHHIFSFCHPELPDERSEGGRLQNAKHFDKGAEGSVGMRKDSSTPLGMTKDILDQLEELATNPKVIAIGETGLDRHIYEKTHYQNYKITEQLINLQKLFFKKQIQLAIKHQKSLIIHNRQAVPELLEILKQNWDPFLEKRSVFHCCEPDQRLLDFALKRNIFIGIDGDITYDQEKQNFLKKTPIELLVLETDSPYFIPEPLKSLGSILNEPKNLLLIAQFIATLKNLTIESVIKMSSQNSSALFKI